MQSFSPGILIYCGAAKLKTAAGTRFALANQFGTGETIGPAILAGERAKPRV